MKRLSKQEYNDVLLGLLEYFNRLCRDNGIKYSLIGGSLIGAIRHKGFIPWDNDADVILMPEEYSKLQKVIARHKDDRYTFLNHQPFVKLVDTSTFLKESGLKRGNQYGIFLDIFCYVYVPNNKVLANLRYNQIRRVMSLCYASINTRKYQNEPIKRIVAKCARLIGHERWARYYIWVTTRPTKKTSRILCNWPSYAFSKEYQLVQNFNDYIDCDFEKRKLMITKNYDAILRTTFGDYMRLPPADERRSHQMTAYWRNK